MNSITLTDPTKEYYDFVGWECDGIIYDVIDTSTAKNYEFIANWKLHEYSISYELNGGTTENPATYTIESEDIVLSIPVKKGYTFVGWTFEGQNEPLLDVTIFAKTTGDKEFTAHWVANIYTITLDANGGVVEEGSLEVIYDQPYTLSIPTRVGYTFEGWFSETTEFISGVWNHDADVTLEARWTAEEYTLIYDDDFINVNIIVTFNYNCSEIADKMVILEKGQILDYPAVPTRSGYAFSGWYIDSSCTTQYDFSGALTEDKTFYAKWVAMTSNYYSREYVDIANHTTYSNQKEFSVTGPTSSAKNFWYFTCYNTGTYTLNAEYVSGDFWITVYNVTKSTTILYQYNLYSGKPSKTVSFIADAGDVIYISLYNYYNNGTTSYGRFYVENSSYPTSTAYNSLTHYVVTYNENYNLLTPSRVGYTFGGWYYGDTKIESGVWNYATDMILSALWTPNQNTITFDVNGGERAEDPITVTYEEDYILPIPTRIGYTFLGWFDNDNIQYTDGSWLYESDVTLIAKWEAIKYQIDYTLDGGSNDSNNPSYYTIDDDVTLVAPTKPGYVFLGWTGSNCDVPQIEVSFSGATLSDLEYVANWELGVFTVDYILNGGTNSAKNPTEITILDEFELKEASRTGYTFDSWYLDEDFTLPISSLTNITSDITLFARFVPNEYSAKFISDAVDNKVTITLQHGGSFGETSYVKSQGSTFNPYDYTQFSSSDVFYGWYTDSSYTNRLTENSKLVLHKDTTLYGKREVFSSNYSKFPSDNFTKSSSYTGEHSTSYPTSYYVVPDNVCEIFIECYASCDNGGQYSASGSSTVYNQTQGKYLLEVRVTVDPKGGYHSKEQSCTVAVNPGDVLRVSGGSSSSRYSSTSATIKVTKRYTTTISVEPFVKSTTVCYDSMMPTESILSTDYLESRVGYKFIGWEDENGTLCGENWNFIEDKVFTAKWEIIDYVIKYVLDGGTNSPLNPGHYNVSQAITLEDAAKAGYTFEGWYADEEFTQKVTSIDYTIGNRTLYAKYTPNSYIANLDLDGGTSSPTVTFISDGEIVDSLWLAGDNIISSYYPLAKEGYIFGGWYLDENCQNVFNFSQVITEDLTLYAKWISSDVICHNITSSEVETELIDINGTSEIKITFVPLASGSITISTISLLDVKGILYNENMVKVAEADDISDEDFNFSIIYNVEAGKQYTIVIKGATTLTKGDCNVLFDFDGSMGISGTTYTSFSLDVVYDSAFELPILKKDGYEFLGWFDENGNEVNNLKWTYASNITIYANWKQLN